MQFIVVKFFTKRKRLKWVKKNDVAENAEHSSFIWESGDIYIDGSCAVYHINCSLVTQVSRQMQSEGYQ